MRWLLPTAALLLTGCAADVSEDDDLEEVGTDSEEVSAPRCGAVKAKTTVRVKVMTLNLRHDADDWRRRFALIADEIVRLDPDVIGLQEVEIGKGQADALNDLIKRRGHAKYHVHQKRKPGVKGFFTGEGVGIMSRWPMAEKAHEDLPEMRISVFARIKHPSGGSFDVLDTHLHHKGGAAADAIRLEEAKQTVDLANRRSDCYATFLTGDMNAKEGSPALRHFASAGFADSYRAVHGDATAGTGATSPIVLRDGAFTQNPRNRIDFVLGRSAGGRTVRPVASIVALRNHDAKGYYPSDHLAVMTTFDVGL